MGVIQRQSIKGTIYSYIGVVLGFITTALLYPFILTEDEVGVTKLLLSYSALAAQFAGLGFNGVTVRLFPYFRDKATANKGFLYLALIIFGIGIVIGLGGLLLLQPWIISQGAEKSAFFAQYFGLIYPLVVFQLLFATFDNYYAQLYNSTFSFFLREVFQRVMMIAAIVAMYFNVIDFNGFVYAFVFIVCFPTLLLIWQIKRDGYLIVTPTLKHIDKKLWKEIFVVSGYSIMTSFTGVVILNIDSIMLSTMTGIGATGIYAINYFFGVMIQVPARPMIKISNAVISDAWNTNDIETIKNVYKKSTINQFIVGSFLLILLLINIDSIYQYLPIAYSEGRYVLVFIAIASWIEMATGVSKSVLGTSDKYMIQTIAMIGLAGLVVVTNYIFIPQYGLNGAAFASFLSLTAFNAFRYFYIWYQFKMQPLGMEQVKILILTLAILAGSYALPLTNNFFIDIPYRSLIIIIIFALSVYYLKISTEMNGMIDKFLMKLLKK